MLNHLKYCGNGKKSVYLHRKTGYVTDLKSLRTPLVSNETYRKVNETNTKQSTPISHQTANLNLFIHQQAIINFFQT